MDFRITQGDTPTITDTLLNSDGTAFNLTGWTVTFNWQGPSTSSGNATIVSASEGKVSFKFSAAQTAEAGDYTAQWKCTKVDDVRTFPTTPLTFEIALRVPETAPTQFTLLKEFYDPVRAILGDFSTKFRRYEDSALASVLRTMLRMGRVPGYALTADTRGITPAMSGSDVKSFALLVYHAAFTLIGPQAASYGYRTRAMSESFGDQRHFVADLRNAIYELEFGEMFVSYQSFYSWVNGMAGQNVWAVLSEMRPPDTLSTIHLNSSGVYVASP